MYSTSKYLVSVSVTPTLLFRSNYFIAINVFLWPNSGYNIPNQPAYTPNKAHNNWSRMQDPYLAGTYFGNKRWPEQKIPNKWQAPSGKSCSSSSGRAESVSWLSEADRQREKDRTGETEWRELGSTINVSHWLVLCWCWSCCCCCCSDQLLRSITEQPCCQIGPNNLLMGLKDSAGISKMRG